MLSRFVVVVLTLIALDISQIQHEMVMWEKNPTYSSTRCEVYSEITRIVNALHPGTMREYKRQVEADRIFYMTEKYLDQIMTGETVVIR